MVAKIFIDGEAGTTGLQIRERLTGRRDLEILSIAPDRRKDAGERKRLLNAADVAILCLPDDAARESVRLIENDTTRVIDASTAYRVADGWAYGFAEMDKAQSGLIAGAKRVSNPGCWPQGVIATLRPLIDAGLLPADLAVSVHGISGYSGGGRTMIEDYEGRGAAASGFHPYGLTLQHKHIPEMQTYTRLAARPLFTPAVGNFRQGMITIVPLQLCALAKVPGGAQVHAAIADHYAAIKGSMVDVAPLGDATGIDPQAYNDTNRMRLHVMVNDQTAQAALIAVYDNLGKGASGAAVQNLELMLGLSA
ncbi:MAG: N-acetyl-gamma-glutamyl-phosphate reductase [Burkholderiaceae bacterium]